jgi:hypothetical protein
MFLLSSTPSCSYCHQRRYVLIVINAVMFLLSSTPLCSYCHQRRHVLIVINAVMFLLSSTPLCSYCHQRRYVLLSSPTPSCTHKVYGAVEGITTGKKFETESRAYQEKMHRHRDEAHQVMAEQRERKEREMAETHRRRASATATSIPLASYKDGQEQRHLHPGRGQLPGTALRLGRCEKRDPLTVCLFVLLFVFFICFLLLFVCSFLFFCLLVCCCCSINYRRS